MLRIIPSLYKMSPNKWSWFDANKKQTLVSVTRVCGGSGRTHLLWEALLDMLAVVLRLGILSVGVAAGAGHFDPVALQNSSLWWGESRRRHNQMSCWSRSLPRQMCRCAPSSPMLALLFISLRRLANQLYTFNAVTRSNSDSLQPVRKTNKDHTRGISSNISS